jgi:hypothetical protein
MSSNVHKLGVRAFRVCARRYGKMRRKHDRDKVMTSAATSNQVDDDGNTGDVFACNMVVGGQVAWIRDVQFAHVKGRGPERAVTFSSNALDAFSMWYHYVADPKARSITLLELLRARCSVGGHHQKAHLFLFDTEVDRMTPDDIILRITYVFGDDPVQEHTLAYSLHGNLRVRFPLYSHLCDVRPFPRVQHADVYMEHFMGPFRNFYARNQARYNVYLHDVYGPRARQLQTMASMTYHAADGGDTTDEVNLLLHESNASSSCSLTTLLELRTV